MNSKPLSLFEGYGVELEYMIVDATTLGVRPITDRVLAEVAGEITTEVELEEIAWSNELALHVIELKTNGPASSLDGLAEQFQQHVRRINQILAGHDARLMPTAMHPWMDPAADLKLWPHDYNPVYETFNRIFDCKGHGWSNLQSVHLNLPFADDREFASLHAAIRLLMPIMPALSASSPFADRQPTGWMDYRMEVYRQNSRKIPEISGQVIPESVSSRAEYEQRILQPMYQRIAPHDPDKVLQYEWLNARGAIARFMRNTIEIRVLDVQECPAADLAICHAIVAVLRKLIAERWTPLHDQQALSTETLVAQFQTTIRDADQALVTDAEYLAQFGLAGDTLTAGDVWRSLAQECGLDEGPLRRILEQGPLARRIARDVRGDMDRLPATYRQLCEDLDAGRMFHADNGAAARPAASASTP